MIRTKISIVKSAPNDRWLDIAPKSVRGRGVWWHYLNLPRGYVLVVQRGDPLQPARAAGYDTITYGSIGDLSLRNVKGSARC